MRVQVGSKRLGVALGAGGLRGAAHIGVLRSLEKHGIPVHALAGSSAGAVVSAFYATGFSTAQMEQLALSLDARQLYDSNLNLKSLFGAVINALLALFRVPFSVPFPQGLIQGEAWEAWLYRQLGQQQVATVPLPIAILATDVNTGQVVVFSQTAGLGDVTLPGQPLALAVRASSAIPGVFCPASVAGRTLVDGGVKASVPAGLLRRLPVDVVLAVDLGADLAREQPVDNIYEIISQSLDIIEEELTAYQLVGIADLIVRPAAGEVGLRDFDRVPQLIALGETAMDQAIPELRALLNR